MPFLYYALFSLCIAAADQAVKYLTVLNIPLSGEVPFLPGLLQLTYVQNNGAAFSSFQGQQWLFALIFVVFTGLIAAVAVCPDFCGIYRADCLGVLQKAHGLRPL